MTEALLSIRGLETAYGAMQVLFGVDMEVQAGEIVAIIGPNLTNTIVAVTVVYLPRYVRLVRIEPGRLEIEIAGSAPVSLAGDLAKRLNDWTGRRWVVSLATNGGGPTLDEAARVLGGRWPRGLVNRELRERLTGYAD